MLCNTHTYNILNIKLKVNGHTLNIISFFENILCWICISDTNKPCLTNVKNPENISVTSFHIFPVVIMDASGRPGWFGKWVSQNLKARDQLRIHARGCLLFTQNWQIYRSYFEWYLQINNSLKAISFIWYTKIILFLFIIDARKYSHNINASQLEWLIRSNE